MRFNKENATRIPLKNGIQRSMSGYYVYILASKRNGTLYVGSTGDITRRIYEHRNNLVDGFTKKYGVHSLVYFERCDNHEVALTRERQIKEWKRR